MEALHQLLFNTAPLADMPVQDDYSIKTYAIVDAAADQQHYQQLLRMDLNYAILFKDEDANTLQTVAPYLIELGAKQEYTQWLLKEHWGTHSVIYLKSHYALEPLAQHFRRYTKVVIDPREGDDHILASEGFFAFYDPRVLKTYFTCLTKEQMTEFCQPVICFSYEDEEQPNHLLTSYLKKSGEQWSTLATSLDAVELPDNAYDKGTTESKVELDDDIDVPIMPVIFTVAQQDAFGEDAQRKFCRQLLIDFQSHYDISPDDEDKAVYYAKEADRLGLRSPATQSHYIVIALLIKGSPVKKSPQLKQALQQATGEKQLLHILSQAEQELAKHREAAYAR